MIRASSYRYVDAGAAEMWPPAGSSPWDDPLGRMPSGISAVTNLGPVRDGADEEPIDDALRRAPEQLKIRDRAVTGDDYEFLAREATTTSGSAAAWAAPADGARAGEPAGVAQGDPGPSPASSVPQVPLT